MSLQDKDSHLSGWSCSKTALSQDDAENLLREFAELKRKERKHDPKVLQIKSKYKLKASSYPSPANILHTGRQLPRTPGPGVLPLLPSQRFEARVDDNESPPLSQCVYNIVPSGRQIPRTPGPGTRVDDNESPQLSQCVYNIVPSGRQIPRTPLSTKPQQSHVLKDIQPHGSDAGPVKRTSEVERTVHNSRCNVNNNEIKSNASARKKRRSSRQGQENAAPCGKPSGHTESEQVNAYSRPTSPHRRISELPVQGLNRMRISGVLKKMPGCEYRSEDLEFLKQMEQQEKVKVLKAELLRLRKDLAATNQDKELIIAKKEKIEDDIDKMKGSLEKTIHLGRAFLSRTQDPRAADLSPDDVLKLLNIVTIQRVHQEERRQLVAAQKELLRRKQDADSHTSHVEEKNRLLASTQEFNEQEMEKIQHRIQQLHEEVSTLQTQVKETEKEKQKLEASTQQKRQQISHYVQSSSQPANTSEMEERTQRRLQRILYRKNIYLEREKIIRRLKQELK